MNILIDGQLKGLLILIYALLVISSIINTVLKARITAYGGTETFQNIKMRIWSWWVMMTILVAALLGGKTWMIFLFGLISFLALREFITMTPTKYADHRTLFWAFFIILPYQYFLVNLGWYGMYSIFIPVYGSLIISIRSVLRGDYERFLERTAKIQWGLLVCVYFISYIPALMFLRVRGFEGQNIKLVLFLVLVTQMSDVLQYIVGKSIGKTKIAPNISPNKTVEGFIGGILLASLFGMFLSSATPFTKLQAGLISLAINLAGFCGGLTMSAIKRDRGIKDYGTIIKGHGGMMDRIDSLCFAAPVYFHLIRYYFV